LNEDGTREKMSSRKGVVLMEDLLDEAEQKARAIVEGRDVSDEDVKKIALGAIKFTDFVSDRRTNILFDWNTIFALTGVSGPYVQYAAVRVNKILNDNGRGTTFDEDYDYSPEKAIIAKLLEYPEVVRRAADELEPHKVANYLYELARELNRYYEATPVAVGEVDQATRDARLGVLAKAAQVFEHGLGLLGIEVPEKM
jgi:arginyl-tRNA synthetase